MSLDFIPGYAEAVAREQQARDTALLNVPYSICGIDVRIMTVGDFLALSAAKHPFISGGTIPTRLDIASLLWFLSPDYLRPALDGASPWRAWLHRRRAAKRRAKFARVALRLDYGEARRAIDDYLDFCFLDCPSGGDGIQSRTPCTSWVVSAQHVLAKSYGWTPATIQALTLPEYYQHLRRIHMDNQPGYVPLSKWSGEAKDNFLNKLNSMAEADREAWLATLGQS
jgi:hypothetical protein